MTEFAISDLFESTAQRVPHRPAVITAGSEISYGAFAGRSRRLARYLADHNLGSHIERSELSGHQSGQDLMAQYLHNAPAYLEGMIGAFRARLAPFNVNYRYVADELRYLLQDAAPAAIQYHGTFAPLLRGVLPSVPSLRVLLQVDDGTGNELLPGAVDYDEALSSVPDEVASEPHPDDLYVLYTGGTTGMPKGVLWRQGDAAVVLLGIRSRRENREWASIEERALTIPERPHRVMPLAPFMHGAAQWAALQALCDGHTVVIPPEAQHFDASRAWDTVARHGVTALTIVGDAFAGPLADALEARRCDVPTLKLILSGGAALSPRNKKRLLGALPAVRIVESIGSSETGPQGTCEGLTDDDDAQTRFTLQTGSVVLTEDRTEILRPGHDTVGWLASSGRVPLGYLGDPDKTARTFPVVAGLRLSVPGDRARLRSDGTLELLGREATTINTGGEKVFAEEVERALKLHPDVADAIVCGRQSEQWGREVVAVVQTRPGSSPSKAALRGHCSQHLARYKVPKEIVFVEAIIRTAAGKPDYSWAAEKVRQSALDSTG